MKTLFIIILLIASSGIQAQKPSFFKEDITFRLDREYFFVDGYYWFANYSNTYSQSQIYFPFRDNKFLGSADSIEIYLMPSGKVLEARNKNENGFSFVLNIPSSDTALIRIKYRQKIIGDSAKYILRSTQSWEKPLDSAEYKLIVNKSFAVKSFSYNPDKTYVINDEIIYYWKKNNFMPKEDLIFHF